MAQSLRSIVRTPSALRSGLLAGLAQVVLAFAAAGAGALLAQKFGRSAETDGFLAAYGVYLVLVLAAQAFRMVVVPDLTRAAAEGRLAGESRGYAVAFLALAVPVSVLVAILSGPLGDLITGSLPPASAHVASRALALPALRFAAKLGVGSLPSFSYAYLAASTLVAATAFSLGVISSAPLTRRGIDSESAGRHVVHAAWVSLSLVGAAAGVFALVGGRIVQFVLGDQYKGEVGRQLGHLVVYLSPWMIGWVGFAVTFPLVFVAGRRKSLLPLALIGFVICIPLGLGLRSLWGLPGIAIAIGFSTLVIALGLMAAISTRAPAVAVLGLARLALAVGGAAALTFGGLSLAFSPATAAALGVVAYALVILSVRSLGLSEAWSYVRGLH